VTPDASITLEPLTPPDVPARSAVLRDGRPTGAEIDGIVLEGAFATGMGTLVLTTDDTPFEERLHIRLFAPDGRTLDRADLGHAYLGGIVRDVAVVSPNRLRFTFHRDPVLLDLLDPPRRGWWPWGEPGGARRPVGMRYFRLSAG